jgi:hypothetical protein
MSTVDISAMAPRIRATAWQISLVPIVVIAAAAISLGIPHWRLLALGAAGWVVALLLRQPVMLIALKITSPERARSFVGWMSGPAEELVRLGMVTVFVKTVSDAVWGGLGWAGIEVLLIVINCMVIAKLVTRDDPKALKVQAMLRERDSLTSSSPGWAVVERCSAFALHVGFTLMLFAHPWWVVGTILLHSCTNMVAVYFAKRSVALTEIGLCVLTLAILISGLAFSGMI